MKKKLLSLIMATAMILSLAVPAFAAGEPYYADGTKEEQLTPSITFQATTFVPTISLTMPALNDNPVVLNPYKITITGENLAVNGLASAPGTADQTKQVISPVYSIKNLTDAKLKFTVSATTTVADTVTLSAEPVGIEETKKSAHIMLVIGKKEVADLDSINANNSSTEEKLPWYDTANYETITLKKGEAKSTSTNMAIAAASGTEDDDANFLVFQFQGDMSRTPTASWLNTDTLSTVVKFTFTPDSAQDFTLTEATPIVYSKTTNGTNKVDGKTIADFKAISGLVPEATTPAWKVVTTGAGAYKAALDNGTGDAQKVQFDGAVLKELPEATYDDTVIISFVDQYKVPRTIEYNYKITVNS